MKLRNRFLLVGFGIAIFLILTPALILFARGFKFDFQTRQLIKTGTLVVRTEPQKAIIFIDEVPQKDTTPSTIRFLLPGDYNLRIEKEGYTSWTKRLSVKSQLVTWANHNREFVALFFSKPQLLNTSPFDISLLPESKSDKPGKWVIQNSELIKINPETGVNEIIYKEIPSHQTHQIFEARGQVFLLLDQALFALNDELEQIYAPVSHFSWNEKSSLMIFNNPNEILAYNPETKKTDLILRSTSEVLSAQLNKTTGYVFFQNEGKIKAIELDDRDHRNVYDIAEILQNFQISEDGEKLYTFDSKEIKIYQIR